MRPATKRVCIALLMFIAGARMKAEPNLRTARPVGPCTVSRDDRRPNLFYYAPGEITLSQTRDGKPDLHFLQTRYTGTAAAGDRGTMMFRSLLSFGVTMNGPSFAEVQKAKQALMVEGLSRNPELQPLPIQRLEAALVFALATAGGASETAQALPPGHFEAATSTNSAAAGAYWTERTYTLSLDPQSAQAFWQALQKGQVVLSLAYAFYARGLAPDQPLAELTGSPSLVATLRRQLDERRDPTKDQDAKAAGYLVRAGATAITLDAGRWKDLFRQIDINESAPPGYAALEVYCYDFNNAIQPALYEKQIEVQAVAVAGARVGLTARFQRSQPDLFGRSLRFPVAVRLDRPYRYRVIEIAEDGQTTTTPWKEMTSWTPILDITRRPTTIPAESTSEHREEERHAFTR